jgi:predicted aldo/keto reductase-like oxidoreductase
MQMQTIRLGKTGLMVSRVGMGGIPLTRPTEDEAIRVVHRALDLGINFIDTARGYRTSEGRIGRALAALADRRDQVIVATKGWGDRATTLECIEESLKQLNTDYIDIYQFHGINSFEYYEQILGPGGGMEGAQAALQAGKVLHIGFSSHSLDVALKAVASDRFETVQVPFNLVCKEAADQLVPLAKEHDVGFIAMKPFAGGMLRDANLAIRYLLQFDNVVPDPGIEKVEEIAEIAGIVNSGDWTLSPRERQEIEAIRAEVGTRFCRRCEYCMPCPEGVLTAPLMNQHVLWKLWPAEQVLAWDYVTDAVKSAENCIECGECEEKCPYQLPIREMMAENVALYERMAAEHSA